MPSQNKKKYILKNISRYDVHLGDLRYVIPAGCSCDLLGKNARLDFDEIRKSRESGSISKRLGKVLVEIAADNVPRKPLIILAEPSDVEIVHLAKSGIQVKEEELTEITQETTLTEEEQLLKDLEDDYNDFAPIKE